MEGIPPAALATVGGATAPTLAPPSVSQPRWLLSATERSYLVETAVPHTGTERVELAVPHSEFPAYPTAFGPFLARKALRIRRAIEVSRRLPCFQFLPIARMAFAARALTCLPNSGAHCVASNNAGTARGERVSSMAETTFSWSVCHLTLDNFTKASTCWAVNPKRKPTVKAISKSSAHSDQVTLPGAVWRDFVHPSEIQTSPGNRLRIPHARTVPLPALFGLHS
ncbi:MAG: hypothetical protein JWO08_3774 [Verrucomicrobiaceae bacterium]|nr:hypothetical protein [Verrucomicrobiaceae bacterium]